MGAPKDGAIKNKEARAQSESHGNPGIACAGPDQQRFGREERREKKLCGNHSQDSPRCPPTGREVRLMIHDFAEKMRVDCEERPKDEREPRQLRNVVEPTAEDE